MESGSADYTFGRDRSARTCNYQPATAQMYVGCVSAQGWAMGSMVGKAAFG